MLKNIFTFGMAAGVALALCAPVTGCSSGSGSGGGDGGSSSGAPVCPDPSYMRCSTGAECCTGVCGKWSTGDANTHCTLDCSSNADCVASPTWLGSPGGCNPITLHCTAQ